MMAILHTTQHLLMITIFAHYAASTNDNCFPHYAIFANDDNFAHNTASADDHYFTHYAISAHDNRFAHYATSADADDDALNTSSDPSKMAGIKGTFDPKT